MLSWVRAVLGSFRWMGGVVSALVQRFLENDDKAKPQTEFNSRGLFSSLSLSLNLLEIFLVQTQKEMNCRHWERRPRAVVYFTVELASTLRSGYFSLCFWLGGVA